MTREYNEILSAICRRQVHLHRLKIDDLRRMVNDDPEGRITPARQQCAGMNKEDIIEQILYDEFGLEFDQEIYVEVETENLDASIVIEKRAKAIETAWE